MLNVVKTSSMKVNINEGDDEDAFELLRGETAHFDISCRQRGRGRHLLSEGLSPKVGRIEGAQLGAPFSRIPPLGRTTVIREHFQSCSYTDGGRRSGLDWVKARLAFHQKLGTFSFYSLLLGLCFQLCDTARHLCFVHFSLFCVL